MRSLAVYPSGVSRKRGWGLLHLPVLETVREYIRKCWTSIARVDVAVKEGKAMQMLQDRLIGISGIKDLQLDQSRAERDGKFVRIFLVSERAVTEMEESFVYAAVGEINGRFGTHIHAFIRTRPKAVNPKSDRDEGSVK